MWEGFLPNCVLIHFYGCGVLTSLYFSINFASHFLRLIHKWLQRKYSVLLKYKWAKVGFKICCFLTYLTGINVIPNLNNNELFLNVFICEFEQKFKLSVNWIGLKVVICLPFPHAFHFCHLSNQCSKTVSINFWPLKEVMWPMLPDIIFVRSYIDYNFWQNFSQYSHF